MAPRKTTKTTDQQAEEQAQATEQVLTMDEVAEKLSAIDSLTEQIESTNKRLLEMAADRESLNETIRHQELEIKSLKATAGNSDHMIEKASKVLERLEAEKRRGGANAWRIYDNRYADKQGNSPSWIFYSDATEAREALDDFRKRTKSQHDQSEVKDPFTAELEDIGQLDATTA